MVVFLGVLLLSCNTEKSENPIQGKWKPLHLDTTAGQIRDTADFTHFVVLDLSVGMGPELIEFRSDSFFADEEFRGNYKVNGNTVEFRQKDSNIGLKSRFSISNDTLVLNDFPEKGFSVSFKR
jgi:hypothetical protein